MHVFILNLNLSDSFLTATLSCYTFAVITLHVMKASLEQLLFFLFYFYW